MGTAACCSAAGSATAPAPADGSSNRWSMLALNATANPSMGKGSKAALPAAAFGDGRLRCPQRNSRIATSGRRAVAFCCACSVRQKPGQSWGRDGRPAGRCRERGRDGVGPAADRRRGRRARQRLGAGASSSRPLQPHLAALLPRSGRPRPPLAPGLRPPSSRGLKTAAGCGAPPNEAAAAARPATALLFSRSLAAGAGSGLPASGSMARSSKVELRGRLLRARQGL